MKIIILGSGSSSGVPIIGCHCKVCLSKNPKNTRTRASIFIEKKDTKILIDSSPDLRQQALKNNITSLDAVVYTHDHADHIGGIDDLKSFAFLANKSVPIYADSVTLEAITKRFNYIFVNQSSSADSLPHGGHFAFANANIVESEKKFKIKDLELIPFKQKHGKVHSLGFRIDDFAYSTDVNQFDDEALSKLSNLKLWIVDCISHKPNSTHLCLEQALEWIERVSPRSAILTHMSHDIDYDYLLKKLPPNIILAYDGLSISISDL